MRNDVEMRSSIYGPKEIPADDPTEVYHEVSKLYSETFKGMSGPVSSAFFYPGFIPEESLGQPTRSQGIVTHHLPEPERPSLSILDAIDSRTSTTKFRGGQLSQDHLSTLLHAGYGLRPEDQDSTRDKTGYERVVPSAGGLYPLDLYCSAASVAGLEAALFHYDPPSGGLEQVADDSMTEYLARNSLMPELVNQAAAIILITASFWRNRAKYGHRAYRYVLLEAGHIAQNILLTATALGLTSVPWGGYFDRPVDQMLGLDGVNEGTVYLISVGT